MTGFTDAVRGDGLARAQRALAGLDGDPLRLDRERQGFNGSPPPYKSDRSGMTTQSASLDPPNEEQRRVQLGCERAASKPYHQFEHQIEEERRRIWNADPSTSWMSINPRDDAFEEEASETIKWRWVEQGIWNNKWSKFASGRWKHEEPLELESESETDSQAGSAAPFFPLPQRRNPSPIESNHRQASQKGLTAEIDSSGLENGDAKRPPSASNSPRPSSGKRVLCPTKGLALRPSGKKPIHKDGQPVGVSLGPVHSSKVSKAAGKKQPGPKRQPNISQEVSFSGLPSSSGMDTAESQPSPKHATTSRSKRIQPPFPGVTKDLTKAAPTDPSKHAARSNPQRNVTSKLTPRSSAKPQGISKRNLRRLHGGMQGRKGRNKQLGTQ
ncbi:hypothetical protein B0O99DRAFT_653532 [Bisporella sp. PMI_857]|nr:hypothetical protein B0O99DRAFT_653532 [Bisporella sp. PMI_857]